MAEQVSTSRRGAAGSTAHADGTIQRVGARIRARRQAVGMTLNELADLTGVSTSMLSMLERGVAGASIGTLVAVSSALRVHMYDLFDHPAEQEQSPVSRREDQTEVETSEGVLRRVVHFAAEQGLELVVNEYEPGTSSGTVAVHHAGTEFGVVIAGSLSIELGGVRYDLRVGDGISYDSSRPHRIFNRGRGKARAVWVNLGS